MHRDKWAWLRKGWYALALLAVIVGIEFAFPNGSAAQMAALAVAVAFFGSIIAWRTLRRTPRAS